LTAVNNRNYQFFSLVFPFVISRDPNQGVALAQAILEDLLEAGCRVAITTHFLQLKQLATSDPRFAVGGMQFINGKPTYKLLPGTVGESFALSVAERLELPRRVVDRAAELMDSDTLQMGDLIRELEDQKILVDQEGKELEIRRRDMANLEQQLRDEMARLERKQLQVRREEAKKFARMLEEKEKVLETILEKLKSDPSRRVVAKSWEEIKCVKRDALVEAEMVSSALLQKRKADDELAQFQAELVPIADVRDRPALEPGDKVVVCRKGPLLGREATITKNLGGRVEVSVNNMNVGLRLTEVALPTKGKGNDFSTSLGKNSPSTRAMSKAAERALREERAEKRDTSAIEQSDTISSRSKSSIAIRTESNTVDVRGCTLDEAKTKGTEAFSRCLMSGRSVVYILHGHGTGGVLKAKIRSWLQSERSLVRRYLPADRSDGGDAFTRVELR
jgi:DNA mismatch repair protein MutS2